MLRYTAQLIIVLTLCASFCVADLVNIKVARIIDITTQFARHSLSITVENKGSSVATQYELALQENLVANLAYISVNSDNGELVVTKGGSDTQNKQSFTVYNVGLDKGLAPGKTFNLQVTLVLAHALKPFPTHISQTEHQLVRYYDNHFFFSPYATFTQKTTVKLASAVVEYHSEEVPSKINGDTINYGSYDNVKPYTHSDLSVHSENNSPFLVVTKMVKEFEISHWGNLAVEQWLEIRHDGAVLKGQFSRFDFQRNPGASPAAILQLTEVLPSGAAGVYYRDDIGNISTSSFSVTPKGLELHLIPRFPLFGGWKNNFYMGYNLPLDLYLFNEASDASTFVLNATFASSIGNVFVEDFTVKIILPEGAKNPHVITPFLVDAQSEEKHYTYLDTIGRTVLVINKHRVVPEHNQHFQVEYHYSRVSMLQEPLLVTLAFFLFFLAIMFFVRFQLSINPPVDLAKVEQRQSEVLSAVRSLLPKFEAEVARLTALAEQSSDLGAYKRQKGTWNDLLVSLGSLVNRGGEHLVASLKDLQEAQTERFTVLSSLHERAIEAKGNKIGKKPKLEKERQALEEQLREATNAVQDFKDHWLS